MSFISAEEFLKRREEKRQLKPKGDNDCYIALVKEIRDEIRDVLDNLDELDVEVRQIDCKAHNIFTLTMLHEWRLLCNDLEASHFKMDDVSLQVDEFYSVNCSNNTNGHHDRYCRPDHCVRYYRFTCKLYPIIPDASQNTKSDQLA